MGDKYCENCRQPVSPKKNFHIVAFLLLVFFVWIPVAFWWTVVVGVLSFSTRDASVATLWLVWLSLPVLYILNHVFLKTPRCPICNKKLR